MPVLVNAKACLNRDHCFAAAACPYDAYIHNQLKKTWEVDANVCGDCPGPCLNFCDQDALRWGDDLVDLKFIKAELDGTMTPVQIAEARVKHKKQLEEAEKAAKAAAQKKSVEGVIELTRSNFEREVLRSDVPVVVDCWADWCGPCKQFSPIFESLALQYVGVVKFAKLNTDDEPALAQGLGVQALPTVLMFYKGQLANAAEGAMPAQHFQAWIYQTLTAIRQYESQFDAESDAAVNAAADNLKAMDSGVPFGPDETDDLAIPPATTGTAGGTSPSSVLLDSRAPRMPAPPVAGPDRPEPPGKKTSSGLYIP